MEVANKTCKSNPNCNDCSECMKGSPYRFCCKDECGEHEFCRGCAYRDGRKQIREFIGEIMKYKLSEVRDRLKPYDNENNKELSCKIIEEDDGTQTLFVRNVWFYDKNGNKVIKGDMIFPNFIIDKSNNELLVDDTNKDKEIFKIYFPDGEIWQ